MSSLSKAGCNDLERCSVTASWAYCCIFAFIGVYIFISVARTEIELSKILENEGNYPIYGAAGFIKNVDFYKQEKPYIGIVKDGAGVERESVHPAKSSLIGTMQYILPKENIEIGYLAAYLKSQNLGSLYKGAAIPHIYFISSLFNHFN